MTEVRYINRYRLYIFDFDFTLFDTFEGQVTCTRAALAANGINNVNEGDIKKGIGIPLREFFGKYTDDKIVIDSMQQVFLRRSAKVMVEMAKPYSSTIPVVTELQARGAKLAIVTGKYRDRISRILARFSLEEMFDAIVCGDEVTKDKPDPEGLIKCISRFENIPRKETVYIGDHFYDILAAKACGIDSIAVTSGNTTSPELMEYHPTTVIDDLTELLKG